MMCKGKTNCRKKAIRLLVMFDWIFSCYSEVVEIAYWVWAAGEDKSGIL